MRTRDKAYQGRALRRRKARRLSTSDPLSATDRKRLGDDRGIAASVVRGALVHIASAGSAAVLDDISGFRSEDDYKDARDAVLASFGEMDLESTEHIESLLIRVCSSDRFWSSASDAVRHAESPPTAAELEDMVLSVPMPPGLFCGDERVAMVEPHTQMVIGPLRVQDSLSFSVWPLYKSGSRGSRPVRLSLSELARLGGGESATWSASWEGDALTFSSADAFVRLTQEDLLSRWDGPQEDSGDITGWTVISD